MAALPTDFDHADDPSASFEIIPTRDEILIVRDSERRDTKAGDGWYYVFTIEVMEGPYKGRQLDRYFNQVNPSAKCQAIGRQQLRELAKAVGKPNFGDTCDLHEIPFIGKIVCKKDDRGEMRNDIVSFRVKNAENVAAMNSQQAAPAGATDENPF